MGTSLSFVTRCVFVYCTEQLRSDSPPHLGDFNTSTQLDFEGRVGEHAKGALLKVAHTDFGQMSAKSKYKTNANTLGGA